MRTGREGRLSMLLNRLEQILWTSGQIVDWKTSSGLAVTVKYDHVLRAVLHFSQLRYSYNIAQSESSRMKTQNTGYLMQCRDHVFLSKVPSSVWTDSNP
jgi:hypothetical protein